ncbi:MAG: hypothetical protein IJB90_05510 [Clostridia bacterium]|nr:hypothetical protein [Clostridia bacterium]
MKIEYKKEEPGIIRITAKMESILTPERCMQEAEKLLNGKNNGNLKYGDTPELCDNILLSEEIADNQSGIHTVIFTLSGEDVIVNRSNIKEISDQLLQAKKCTAKQNNEDVQAIKDAMAEIWGDIGK